MDATLDWVRRLSSTLIKPAHPAVPLPEKRGWLHLNGKRFWFVLRSGRLSFFASENATTGGKRFNLAECHVRKVVSPLGLLVEITREKKVRPRPRSRHRARPRPPYPPAERQVRPLHRQSRRARSLVRLHRRVGQVDERRRRSGALRLPRPCAATAHRAPRSSGRRAAWTRRRARCSACRCGRCWPRRATRRTACSPTSCAIASPTSTLPAVRLTCAHRPRTHPRSLRHALSVCSGGGD